MGCQANQKQGGSAITKYSAPFEGREFTTYVFRGRPCAMAISVGDALEYGNGGKELPDVVRAHWSKEMIKGRDFDVLTGQNLRDFKGVLDVTDAASISRAPHLMVLYESGVDLVCIKTKKPLGMKLRRFIVDDVLPKLRRGEAILPDGASRAEPELPESVDGQALARATLADGERTRELVAGLFMRHEARFEGIESRLTALGLGGGVISYDQDLILKDAVDRIANMRHQLGHNASFRAARTAVNQRVASVAEWGGTGTRRARMPADRFPRVEVALKVMRADLEAEAKRRKVTLKPFGSAPQGNLFGSSNTG